MAFTRRRIWQMVGALAVVVVLVLSGLLVRTVLRARTRLTQTEANRRVRVAPDPPRLDVRQRTQVEAPAVPLDSFPLAASIGAAGDDPLSFARTTAAEYRKRARYPRWSQPIEGLDDPLLLDQQAVPATSTAGDEPTLTAFAAQQSFESPEAVTLYAQLSNGGTRVASHSVRGTVLDDQQQTVCQIVYNDEGRGGDEQAGDHLYTARLTVADDLPDATAAYKVTVRAISQERQERTAVAPFVYSRPEVRLTGSYRDAAQAGDLTVDAEVDVSANGRFHLEGTLYSADGQQPLAWAQHTIELPPGKHWVPLRFYGLILRERGIDGPYLVRSVALSTLTQLPVAKNRLVENAHVTGRYAANSFTDRPFDDPDLLEAADRIEQVIEGLVPETGS